VKVGSSCEQQNAQDLDPRLPFSLDPEKLPVQQFGLVNPQSYIVLYCGGRQQGYNIKTFNKSDT